MGDRRWKREDRRWKKKNSGIRVTTSQIVQKPVIATPDLIRGKQSPPW
jgi:hypothetical protein